MNSIFTPLFTWPNFFASALTLAIVYFVLKILERILNKAILPERILVPLQNSLRWILLFFEPTTALLLLVIFIFIRPSLNGPVIALLLLGGFAHLKNYLSGFIMKMYESIKVGNRLRTAAAEGVVTFVGRLGIRLRTSDGLYFANYSKLISEGYTLVTGEESGGFFNLKLSPKKNEDNDTRSFSTHSILDILAQAPYLSPNHKPDISQNINDHNIFSVKLLVEEEHHLFELITLLEEKGWKTEVNHGSTFVV